VSEDFPPGLAMLIENVMYFALGALAAGLLALLIIPAVWRRAVRLTKKRIEAATPMSMAEFRADKDQLRAEFALSTRRLEMNVEALRKRLAEQLGDINKKKSDLGTLKTERDQYLSVARELEEREAELKRRVMELEKEGTDIAQRLRMRDRDYAAKVAELDLARENPRGRAEVSELAAALSAERKRASFLEDQVRKLTARLETTDRRSADANAAVRELRTAMAKKDDAASEKGTELVMAEARIASAESRLNALLEEVETHEQSETNRTEQLVAEKVSLEAQVEQLRRKVETAEAAAIEDWTGERIQQAHLRERLNDIASTVSRLVYAVDGTVPPRGDESLFDKVQRFAGEEVQPSGRSAAPRQQNGNRPLSGRLSSLQDLQR
jgi:chromosome segregation ATPase